MNKAITHAAISSGMIYLGITPSGTLDGDLMLEERDTKTDSLWRIYSNPSPSDEAPSFVLVGPCLDLSQTVTLNDSAIGEIVINPKKIRKLASISRKENPQCTEVLREIVQGHYFSYYSLEVVGIIPSPEGNIIRGRVSVPVVQAEGLIIKCLDAKGNKVNGKLTLRQFEPDTMDSHMKADSSAASFSFVIPHEISNYYFLFHLPRQPELDTCACVSKEELLTELERWQYNTLSAGAHPGYDAMVKKEMLKTDRLARQKEYSFGYQPTFSIVVPLYNTPAKFFTPMVESVLSQTYPHWQLILVNSTPENTELSSLIKQAEKDSRITVVNLSSNLGITGNTNEGVKLAKGDFICFFDHDDLLAPTVLFEYVLALDRKPDIDLLYCDEDKLYDNGAFSGAFYKPDFSIDQLRNNNYICHLLSIRKTLLDEIGPTPDGYDGAQDHWLTLRAVELARRVWHVRKILYHWRATENSTALTSDNKPYASDAGVRAVQDHLDRLGIPARVENYGRPFACRVRYLLENDPLITIIIPNKDNVEILERCLSSIHDKTTYGNYEILVIENNSLNPGTFSYYKKIEEEHKNLRVLTYESQDFNYSAINNFGVSAAKGDYLLFLNNDTEVLTPDWLQIMAGYCSREDVGAVGVRLFYPDDTYQHAGLAVAGEGVNRLFVNMSRGVDGYFTINDMTRNVSAVTAACMMTRKEVYNSVEGFDESFAVSFNDVDFCLRLREKGLLVVYTADVDLYHYESFSRGIDHASFDKKTRMFGELFRFKARWSWYYSHGDPYYNNALDQNEPGADYFKLPYIDMPDAERTPFVAFLARVYHWAKGRHKI